eukprot:1161431-Pelagomonas_calceolata.AAC.2
MQYAYKLLTLPCAHNTHKHTYTYTACTGIADAHLGYKFAVDRMNGVSGSTPLSEQKRRGLVTQMFIKDAEGNEHRVSFNYTRVAYRCFDNFVDNFALHQGLMSDLVNQTHFLLGSSPVQASIENAIAHEARKLLYHCCVTPDANYAQDMPYMFGASASNSKYTLQALKSMALAGGVRKLFLFYLEVNEFTKSTCLSAVQYVNDVVIHLAPGTCLGASLLGPNHTAYIACTHKEQ